VPEVDVVGGVVELAEHVLLERGPDGPEDSASVLNEENRELESDLARTEQEQALERVRSDQTEALRVLTYSLFRGTVMTWSSRLQALPLAIQPWKLQESTVKIRST
jgi:hypothetical protein